MHNVIITKQIELALSASDWGLYTSNEESAFVARMINRGVQAILNDRPQKTFAKDSWFLIQGLMSRYADYGAADTEPREMARQIVEEFYG